MVEKNFCIKKPTVKQIPPVPFHYLIEMLKEKEQVNIVVHGQIQKKKEFKTDGKDLKKEYVKRDVE